MAKTPTRRIRKPESGPKATLEVRVHTLEQKLVETNGRLERLMQRCENQEADIETLQRYIHYLLRGQESIYAAVNVAGFDGSSRQKVERFIESIQIVLQDTPEVMTEYHDLVAEVITRLGTVRPARMQWAGRSDDEPGQEDPIGDVLDTDEDIGDF